MDKETTISGTIENIIFNNPENGYTVFSVVPGIKSGDDEIVCVGFMNGAEEGETVELCGNYTVHSVYGRQFTAKSCKKTIPTTPAGIEKYLASGAIKGIGEKLAQKIVAKFNHKTLAVIEESPELLSQIKGITVARALAIGEEFREKTEERNTIIALQTYGITVAQAKKIYERYKGGAIKAVKADPYGLADEIFGIGFKIADNIAFNAGFKKDDPLRIKAGIRYILSQEAGNGHCCLPKDFCVGSAAETLEAEPSVVENALILLQMDRSVCMEKLDETTTMIYLNSFLYAENYVAKKLAELSARTKTQSSDIISNIAGIEKQSAIELSDGQKNAVVLAVDSNVMVITGGPGTGKTTVINTIIKIFEKQKKTVELCAPTGRAAKRMTEATGREAKTIHRLLGVNFSGEKTQQFQKNEDDPLETDVLIVDESSMIDLMLMFNLLKAVQGSTKLIFVGDADQLPSVGPGNVLKDIISSYVINTVKLTDIFRQEQESAIIMNAHRINRGLYPVFRDTKDFFLVKRSNFDSVSDTIIELVKTRLPSYLNLDNSDIQVISPMRKSKNGVVNLNRILQQSLNPADEKKNETEHANTLFREGDKVMQIKNNYQIEWSIIENGKRKEEGQGLFNGDEGIVKEINEARETLTVIFEENKHVAYGLSQLDELELAYAVTVHKSQGSEYDAVVLPVHSGPFMLMNRNILYTAVTRAKKCVVLVGTEEMIMRMIDNNREIERYSALAYRIKKFHKKLQ